MTSQAGMQGGPSLDVGLDHNIAVEEVEPESYWKNIRALGEAGKWASVLKILRKQRNGDSRSSIPQLLQPMNSNKDTIVHRAALEGRTEVVRILLLLIKDNQELWRERQANIFGNTPLHLAAVEAHKDTCKCLAEIAPETAMATNKDGNTPLHLVVAKRRLKDTCKYLAEMAPETAKAANVDGNTPLHLAASNSHEDTCKCLAEVAPEAAKATNKDGNTPLHLVAASRRLKDTCKYLADMAPDTAKVANVNGDTPLHLAAANGLRDTSEYLAKKAPEAAKATNKDGDTPLHLAASEGHGKTCEYLVKMAPETAKVTNKDNNTPLHLAAASYDVDNCKCLADMAPETAKAKNADGDMPIFVAAFSRYEWVFNTLTSMFLDDLDIALATRKDGNTILHYVISREEFEFASTIIDKHRGLIYSRNNRGLTPLHLLANNPSAFKSGCRLGLLERFFYSRIEVSTESKSDDLKHQKREERTFKFLGSAWWRRIEHISEIRKKKKKHKWAKKVLKQLVHHIDHWSKFGTGMCQIIQTTGDQPQQDSRTHSSPNQPKEGNETGIIESPLLIAGKKGVKEMVRAILVKFPTAIYDVDLKDKNVMQFAAEHRQYEIFNYVRRAKKADGLCRKVDNEGNSVLHLAANYPQKPPVLIPGAASQMFYEYMWFKHVKETMPPHFSTQLNHKGHIAMEVFIETHRELAMERAKWLRNATQSCSVVAALITAVAFATISAVAGGLQQNNGSPLFQGRDHFNTFAISSFIAFCFSALSLIMFLGILFLPNQDLDFGNDRPTNLIWGINSLFVSIVAMFLSFFFGDLFVLDKKMKYVAYPTFVLTFFMAISRSPLYSEFTTAFYSEIPDFRSGGIPKRAYPYNLSF